MSDTPRTDKAQWEEDCPMHGRGMGQTLCRASHAQQLEREARAWKAALGAVRALVALPASVYGATPEQKAALEAIDAAETLAWNQDYGN